MGLLNLGCSFWHQKFCRAPPVSGWEVLPGRGLLSLLHNGTCEAKNANLDLKAPLWSSQPLHPSDREWTPRGFHPCKQYLPYLQSFFFSSLSSFFYFPLVSLLLTYLPILFHLASCSLNTCFPYLLPPQQLPTTIYNKQNLTESVRVSDKKKEDRVTKVRG